MVGDLRRNGFQQISVEVEGLECPLSKLLGSCVVGETPR